jgi:hypothetical protein
MSEGDVVMIRRATVIAVSFALGIGTTALASSSIWRVIATGNDTSDYGAYASASADVRPSQALAVRAMSSPGKLIKTTFYLICQGDRTLSSGQILVASVATATKCSLSGSASTDYTGRVRVELLRR